jgi:hypothetical protein
MGAGAPISETRPTPLPTTPTTLASSAEPKIERKETDIPLGLPIDLTRRKIASRKPEDVNELQTMHDRYLVASPPGAGEQATTAYRLRLLFLDRWNLWPRLTKYRTWQGPDGETLDGTNNSSERAIGWWIKERYRTMRGYKRRKSAVNVSRLLAWCGNHLNRGGADLSLLLA